MLTNKIRLLFVSNVPPGESDLLRLLTEFDPDHFLLPRNATPSEALEGLRSNDLFDVCIVDLPDSCGITFLSDVRSIDGKIPILLVTKAEDGPDCLIPEQVNSIALEARIRRVVRQSEPAKSDQDERAYSERRYRRIVDESKEIIYRISPRGYFTFVNPAAAAIVSRTVNECLGLHFLTLIRKDYQKAAAQFYLEQIMQQDPITYFEFPALVKDGTEVWIGQSVQLVIDNGEVIELQALGRNITAQKQAEQRLLESEQRYRLLFEANPHPMWVYDVETLSFLAVNEAAIRHYGYSLEDFLSLTIKDIRPADEQPRLLANLSGTGGTLRDPWKHVKKDGTIIDVEINAHPLMFDSRRAEVITATDITDRLRGEAERQVMLDIIQSINVTSNLDELLHLVHNFLQRILYAENCFVALNDPATNLMHFEFWVDKFDPTPAPRRLDEGFTGYVLNSGQPLLLTEEFKHQMYSSGKVVKRGTSSASWLGVPLLTPSRTIGVLVVQHYENQNVYTQQDHDFLMSVGGQVALAIERKRAEHALIEANQRAVTEYEMLLERLTRLAETFGTARELATICQAVYSFALASTPCNGMFVSLRDSENDELRVVFACSEGVELNVDEFQPMLNSNSPHSRAVISGEVVVEHDLRSAMPGEPILNSCLKNDPRVPQSSLAAPMIIKGRVIGAVEVQSPQLAAFEKEHVTAMRMAANLAANAMENVRLLELERSREQQLLQSQKMEAIGQLAGGVAHDFNNLLTAINGYSELVLRRLKEDAPEHRQVSEIRNAGGRAASLTRQLLAFSRKQIMQSKVLDLNSIVAEMDRLLRRLIGEDVDLVTVLKPDLGQVNADPGQMEQVLVNLVVNARDAMPDGGKITIETANVFLDQEYTSIHNTVRPGPYICLIVSDTGVGIDSGIQKRVFEPFFTTKEVGKGTGLGLSTVFGIVKQSGGNISLYSEVGTGTTFKVYLPRIDEVLEIENKAPVLRIPLGTETILVVEDEEIVRKMTRQILELNGHKVLEASCGSEALSICRSYEGPVHLVLSDVVMPNMSGPIMVKELELLRPDIKTLFMSGYTDNAILRHGILDEGVPFLQKPFSPDGLTLKIREVIDSA